MINLKNQIDLIEDEATLREIRSIADNRLQEVKQSKKETRKQEAETKYKNKYLLVYGRTYSMTISEKNELDLKIYKVLDIEFSTDDFFRCSAKLIHIEYDNEFDEIHLTSTNYGSCKIEFSVDSSCDIYENRIEKILTKEEVQDILKTAKENQLKLIEQWEL